DHGQPAVQDREGGARRWTPCRPRRLAGRPCRRTRLGWRPV
ncbi:MAG: hypothetical protein AVDCRST_MAG29-650, partial [uncultured Nocardioidaceae bacterium]